MKSWAQDAQKPIKEKVGEVKQREFIPLQPIKPAPWVQRRIEEYRVIPSLYK